MHFFLRRLQLFLLLILVGCGENSSRGEELRTTGEFTLSSPAAVVEAEIDEFIFLDVEVNGARGRFILDTGADAFVVSRDFAHRLDLAVSSFAEITTIAGVTTADVVRIDEFQAGNVIGVDISAAVLELDGIDGIVGLPFFKAVVVELDYQAQTLVFHDSLEYRLEQVAAENGGILLPTVNFVLSGVRVDGVDVGPVRLDTGSSGGLRLSADAGRSILPPAEQRFPVVASTANGTVPGEAFVAEELSFGGFDLNNQFVVVQPTPLPSGLMGNLLLRQFFIVFDLGSNRILLRRDRFLEYAPAEPLRENSFN